MYTKLFHQAKHRALAQALVMASFSAALFVWPPLVEYLLRTYALYGALIILGGLHLHGCIFGGLLGPRQNASTTHGSQGSYQNSNKHKDSKDGNNNKAIKNQYIYH
jgi:hypothetical protein